MHNSECGACKIYVLPPYANVNQWSLAAGKGLSRNENMEFCSTLLGKDRTDTTLLPVCSEMYLLMHFCLILCTIAFSDLIPMQLMSYKSF